MKCIRLYTNTHPTIYPSGVMDRTHPSHTRGRTRTHTLTDTPSEPSCSSHRLRGACHLVLSFYSQSEQFKRRGRTLGV